VSAYIIAIRDSTRDAGELSKYREMAPKARVDGMRALAAYGTCEALEGAAVEGVVLLEFPDMDTARAWYGSPAYQAARTHRLAGADYRFILTDGL
jgi:uncharacterized protein (DUF1330 family)